MRTHDANPKMERNRGTWDWCGDDNDEGRWGGRAFECRGLGGGGHGFDRGHSGGRNVTSEPWPSGSKQNKSNLVRRIETLGYKPPGRTLEVVETKGGFWGKCRKIREGKSWWRSGFFCSTAPRSSGATSVVLGKGELAGAQSRSRKTREVCSEKTGFRPEAGLPDSTGINEMSEALDTPPLNPDLRGLILQRPVHAIACCIITAKRYFRARRAP